MELIKRNNSEFEIEGNIKTVDDYNTIKGAINGLSLKSGDALVLDVRDSISFPSSVIGFLMKLTKKDGIRVSVKLGDERLMELMRDLSLIELFNVKKR